MGASTATRVGRAGLAPGRVRLNQRGDDVQGIGGIDGAEASAARSASAPVTGVTVICPATGGRGPGVCAKTVASASVAPTRERPRGVTGLRIPSTLLHGDGEGFPFECPNCGGDIRLIAFITDPGPLRKVLRHRGEPLEPPPGSPARGPPTDWGEIVQAHDDQAISQASLISRKTGAEVPLTGLSPTGPQRVARWRSVATTNWKLPKPALPRSRTHRRVAPSIGL